MSLTRPIQFVSALSLVVCGCNDDTPLFPGGILFDVAQDGNTGGASDAGVLPVEDAGASNDAAVAEDATPSTDTGIEQDSAPSTDTGIEQDATPSTDTGAEQDTGASEDSGPTMDAGATEDTADSGEETDTTDAGTDGGGLVGADIVRNLVESFCAIYEECDPSDFAEQYPNQEACTDEVYAYWQESVTSGALSNTEECVNAFAQLYSCVATDCSSFSGYDYTCYENYGEAFYAYCYGGYSGYDG